MGFRGCHPKPSQIGVGFSIYHLIGVGLSVVPNDARVAQPPSAVAFDFDLSQKLGSVLGYELLA